MDSGSGVRVGLDGITTEEGASVEYSILGPIEARRGDDLLDLGGLRPRALLGLLVINANSVVSTDRIIDELWGDGAGKDPQNSLWVTVSRLRSALDPDRPKRTDGSVLVTRQPGYLLAARPEDIDAARFEALAAEGRALLDTDPAAGVLVLGDALALWRGRALEEFTYEPWASAEIERLEQLRLAAVEDRVDAELRCGRSGELVGELESLVRQHPFRQRLVAHLMLALHRSGRQGDALRAFGALRTRLGEELGLEPSHELVELEERIVLDDRSLHRPAASVSVTGRPEPGLAVRGYELREKIGEGSTGHVYRAFQPSVGREVAIKVIRPELANDANFIRRFQAEAKVIASLEHPRIVPVYDYWREPDAAYLVMRSYGRGSLVDALADGPLPTEQAVAILDQVGKALSVAHGRGVTHGDLRPANVLVDADGDGHLADFGMPFSVPHNAADDTTTADVFVAPEMRASGLASVAADIYSYAALAQHTLRGSVGDDDVLDAPLVGPAADVLARAMDPDPLGRHHDIDTLLDELAMALGSSHDRVADSDTATDRDIANPYRGLRAFGETDAGQFFGRERLVERLLVRLGHAGQQGRFVALVGPSGSGKSSVIRAGVVPALRAGAVIGSELWFIATMTPGSQPVAALVDALRAIAVDPPADLAGMVEREGIASAVDAVVADETAQVVVIVDQLEELFSQASPADADAFMDAVAVAVSDRTSRVRFVTTLRADFYDRPLRHGTFGDLLRLGTEVITPMNAAELGGAITAPASEVGVSFEDGLPALIAADLADQGTALPLLQHALTELFARRTGKTVTTDAYREIGGVTGALAQRAESILGDLDNDRAVAREVFLRLVTVAEGSADTRRNALVSDLVASIGGGVAPVLDAFSRHRLVTFDRDPVTRSPSVEISHEALITEWTRLRHWIDDARADVASRQRLTEATHEWVEHDRSDEFTLTGARLGRYEGWLDGPPVRLTDTERAFLAASHDLSDHALHIEQRRVRRLRRLVAAVGVGLVLALVGGAFALIQQRRADEARVDAELATLISNISAVGADDPELAVLLALEAQARAPGSVTDRAVLAALADATVASRIVSRQPLVDDCTGGTFFTDGGVDGIIEIATVDGRLLARSPVSGEVRQSASPPQPCMIGATSGSFGFAGSVDGSLVVAGPNFDVVVDSGPGSFPIDASSNRALIGSRDGIGLYDLGTGSRVGPIIEGLFVSDSAFSADESLIALGVGYEDGRGNDGAFVVLDTASGEPVTEIAASMPGPVAFDDSTGELIVADNDGVSIVDARTGEISNRIPSVEITGYLAVGPIPDGRLALVSRGGIEVVDRTTDAVLSSVGIQNLVQAFVVPDGLVVTVNDVLQSGVYDLDTNALIDGNLEFDSVAVAAFGQGRAMLANAFADEGVGSVEIVNLDSGERSFPELRSADGGPFPAAVLFPEADGFWAVSHPGHVVGRWENGELVDELFLGSGADVRNDDYYPGGRRFREYLAAIGRRPDMTSEVSLIRLGRDDETAEVVFTVDTGFSALDPSNDFGMAHPSVDGGVYVIDNLGQLRIHDATGALVDEIETPVTAPVSIALDPTGSRLALSSQAGIVVVYDTVTWEMIEVPAPAIASQLTFDGDGSTLAISTWSGEVRIFDVESGDTPVTVWTGGGTFASEPGWYDAATDTVWVTASGRLLQIPIDPAAWVEQACSVLDRDLTKAEWDRYVPGEQPLRTVCE